MVDQKFDTLALERIVLDKFARSFEIVNVVAYQIAVSRTDRATIFLTQKKQLYVYIEAQSRLTLGDVKKIMSRMRLRVEAYLPPNGDTGYFDAVGTRKFLEVFPGRPQVTENDIRYYRTLAPYSPALVQISETTDGSIYCFDSDSSGNWRPAVRFSYRRISTS